MRLENIYIYCKKSYEYLAEIEPFRAAGNKLRIQGTGELRYALELLEPFDFLDKPVRRFIDAVEAAVQNKPSSMVSVDTLLVNFKESKDYLLSHLYTLIQLLESMGMQEENVLGLDIKFPANGDFTDFKKNVDDLDFILTKCPFFRSETETLRFKKVDIGSLWFVFAVVGASITAGSIVLNNIAAFSDKCMVIRSHYLTTQQQKAVLEKTAMDQKAKDEILSSIDKLYKILVDAEVKELENMSGIELSDPEERDRVNQCIDRAISLIDKGMQIHTSIESPEETKILFEPLEMKVLSLSKEIKAIEDKGEKSKNDE